MSVGKVKIGNVSISKLLLGGNPFSGFSHQGTEKDLEMKRYYKVNRIKEVLRKAESLNIDFLGRADHHVIRTLLEYWDEGGKIKWIAQTCPGVGDVNLGIINARNGGAKACYIHGGQMDYYLAQNKLDKIPGYIDKIRKFGMAAGIAAHNPKVIEWAEKENLDLDFYMCSYYNPTNRENNPKHVSVKEDEEYFGYEDRESMVDLIRNLSKPAIHYKVLAAGRNDTKEAFQFVAKHLRAQDAVCVGIYTKDNPNMLREDLILLENALKNG